MDVGGAALEVNFTGDELILTLVSLIRATDPRLLRQGPQGLQVDFASFEGKPGLTEDERLLLHLRSALEAAAGDGTHALELSWAEGQRLAQTLDGLEKLQKWEPDVIVMSQRLKSRLMGLTESA
jgi:hypothetical protein